MILSDVDDIIQEFNGNERTFNKNESLVCYFKADVEKLKKHYIFTLYNTSILETLNIALSNEYKFIYKPIKTHQFKIKITKDMDHDYIPDYTEYKHFIVDISITKNFKVKFKILNYSKHLTEIKTSDKVLFIN